MTDVTTLETSIELDFADGRYWFALLWPQAIELERKCGAKDDYGIIRPKSLFIMHTELGSGLMVGADGEVLFTGSSAGIARDIAEIIRLGLIGGNRANVMGEEITVSPIEARELVENYVFPAVPFVQSAATAFAILNAAIHGSPKAANAPKPARNRKAA